MAQTNAEKLEVEKERTHQLRERLRQETMYLRGQYRQHVSTAIIAAFGFLIALVWRDFITLLVSYITKLDVLKDSPLIDQIYSVTIITFISVVGIIIVTRWAKPDAEKVAHVKV